MGGEWDVFWESNPTNFESQILRSALPLAAMPLVAALTGSEEAVTVFRHEQRDTIWCDWRWEE